MSDNQRGALYMMASMFAFMVNDAFMKSMAGALPPMQAVALRSLIATIILFPLLRGTGVPLRGFAKRDKKLILFRGIAEASASILYISALFLISMASASAILQVMPLTITLAGAVFLREKVGWRRLSAILVGFFGVLLILRPGPEGIQPGALLAVAAVVAATAREILTRVVSKSVPSPSITLYTCLMTGVIAFSSILWVEWRPVDLWTLCKLVMTTVMLVSGSYFSIIAVRTGDLAAVNPFRYSSIVFATLLGMIVFGEIPEPLTLLGAAIVVGTGLFTLWRERQQQSAVTV